MPLIDKPIAKRVGFQQVTQEGNPDMLQRDLRKIAQKHGLLGCVFIQFDSERVGARSWGANDEFGAAMDTLATRVLTDIDDGRHDPLEHMNPNGSA